MRSILSAPLSLVPQANARHSSRRNRAAQKAFIWLGSVWLIAGPLSAQTANTNTAATNPPVPAPAVHQPAFNPVEHIQSVRQACIMNRRRICGRVVQILPDGLVVESGYLSLLRPELSRSWLIGANVPAQKTENYVEAKTPGAVCEGLVFIGDIPRRPPVKQYDYVVLFGYPCGTKTYTSVGTIKHTVRRFSAVLVKAVNMNLQASANPSINAATVK